MVMVGFGASVLSVPRGSEMGGYAFREGLSTETLDPLQVTAITWYDGSHRAALVLADLVCVNADLTKSVRAAVRDVDVLWLAASHTHAGPDSGCVPGGGPTPPEWLERVTDAAVAAVGRARSRETAARGRAYTGDVHGVGAVRSHAPQDAVVPLDVIEVVSAGQRSGVLVVLPVHPTVLPADSLLVSADLTGAVRSALEARLGPAVWVAVATGAAGDISTRHTRRAQDPAELARLGGLVADRCLELLAGPVTPAWSGGSELSWDSRTLGLEPKPPADGEALVATASAALSTARRDADPVAARIAEGDLHGARLAAATAVPADSIEAEVAVLRVGRLSLVALPGEPFLGMAEELRAVGAQPTVVLGYANAYPGYLPPKAAYAGSSYEVLAAAVAPGGSERIARAAADLLIT